MLPFARRDQKVAYRDRDIICSTALRARGWADLGNLTRFDITQFVENVLLGTKISTYLGEVRLCRIVFLDDGDEGAYVKFSQPDTTGCRAAELFIQREIWENAALGDGDSRHIVAHEVGHIVLGHYRCAPFSPPNSTKNFVQQEQESAEWQVDQFSAFFLAPNHLVQAYRSPDELMVACDIPAWMAAQRFGDCRGSYEGEACPECANFTLVRNGTCLKCDTCGGTTGCL